MLNADISHKLFDEIDSSVRLFGRGVFVSTRFFAVFVGAVFLIQCGCSQQKTSTRPTSNSSSTGASPPTATAVSKPPRPQEGFTGSQVCSECHAEIADRFFRSGMGRSIAKVNESPPPHEDYERNTQFVSGKRTYRVQKDGENVWHHESISDDEGVIYDQAELVQFAIGSNTRGRSYLMWRDGLIFMSPISWYSQDGWGLSPTYLADRHVRFSRRITEACVVCHSGRVVTDAGREHVFPQPVFLEQSIGCERCHGPGEDHVKYRRNSSAMGDDPILKLDTLAPPERDAVCYQCHFQGEERILRYGRSESDFRPGMKFSDVWTSFIKGNGTDGESTTAVSQAMQMQSSICYQASAGRLGCVSCHDPHETPAAETRSAVFDRRCLECHDKRGCSLSVEQRELEPANGSCIHCHMPSLNASNIPHTSQTDHRILRRRDETRRDSKRSSYTIFLDTGASLPPIERIRAEGLLKSLIAEKTNDRDAAERSIPLLQQAVKAIPDDEVTQQALAGMLLIIGREDASQAVSREILSRFPQNEVSYLRLANAAHNAGRYEEAEGYFVPFIRLNPWIAVTHGRRAHTLGMLNRLDEAIEEAERGLSLDPTILPLYGWLADAHARRGDEQRRDFYQKQQKRLALRLKTK